MTAATLTEAGAHRAAEVLREADAGHEEAATALSDAYGLGYLSYDALVTLCDTFNLERN